MMNQKSESWSVVSFSCFIHLVKLLVLYVINNNTWRLYRGRNKCVDQVTRAPAECMCRPCTAVEVKATLNTPSNNEMDAGQSAYLKKRTA